MLPEPLKVFSVAIISVLKKGGGYGLLGLFLFCWYVIKIIRARRESRLLDIFFVVQTGFFILAFLLIADVIFASNNVNKPISLLIFWFNIFYLPLILGKDLSFRGWRLKVYSLKDKAQIVAAAVLLGYVFFEGFPSNWEYMRKLNVVHKWKLFCSREVYDALQFVKNNTDLKAVVCNNLDDRIYKNNGFGGIALRRSVLDGSLAFGRGYRWDELSFRKREISRIKRVTDSNQVRVFLKKYGVNYFLEAKKNPLKITDRNFLTRVFENKEVIVWETSL
jgi:hypothetical protein